MARKLVKKWIVDTYRHEVTDVEIPISVDPEEGFFWAEYPEGTTIRGDTKFDVQEKLKGEIRKLVAGELEWEQVIVVSTYNDPWGYKVASIVGIKKLKRVERAQYEMFRSGTYKQLLDYEKSEGGKERRRCETTKWRMHPADWKTEHDQVPSDRFSGSCSHVLPYSEELWDRLKAIEAAIMMAREKINEIIPNWDGQHKVDPKEMVARIMASGQLALPGPTGNTVTGDAKPTRKAPPPPPRRS